MDGPFVVAQANIGNSRGTPVQVIKLFKPEPGKTEIFYAGITGVVKIDFSAIANEKITLVHDTRNQSLHIIFADGSQNIIEPFFDSQGVMQNFVLLMGSDQEVTGAELEAHFGATEGRSVLPEPAGSYVASGGEFHPPDVDPLPTPEPLPFLALPGLSALVVRETPPALAGTDTFSNPFPVNPLPPNPVPPAPEVVPALNITKDVSSITGGTADAAGDVITYAIAVQNTGNVALTGVTVIDPNSDSLVRGSDIAGNNDDVLGVGETWSYTASHTVTQAQLDTNGGGDGDIDNTATASSDQPASGSASASVPLVTSPALTVDKAFVSVTGGNGNVLPDAVGDVLNYTVTVTNTGNVTLTGVTVTDPLTAQNDSITTLAPGESRSFNSSYTLTQADFDGQGNAGADRTIDNTATADSDQTAAVTDSVGVPLITIPTLAIDKNFVDVTGGNNNGTADAVGDVLNYTVTVTNAGNVPLTGVTVVDPLTGQNDSITTLAPGESRSFNSSYTLTQADLDTNGDIVNTATADSNESNAVTDSVEVPLITIPTLTIDKTFVNVTGGNDNAQADAVGDVLNYTVTVSNTGNVTLTGVTVTDPLTGQNDLITTLAPGESRSFNSSYTLTQADLDGQGNAGADHDIDNTATADSNETSPESDSEQVTLITIPTLTIDKTFVGVTGGNNNGQADAAGDVLNYTVTVTNAGNVTLTGVTVTDPLTGQNDLITTLAPGESRSFNSSYTLTAADLDGQGNAGADHDIDNTATASSNETGAVTDSAEVALITIPTLTIDKAFVGVTGGNGNGTADATGDQLNYTVTVTNAGNVTLTGVTVTDPLTGQNDLITTLAPGESRTFNSSYTLTQADLDGQGNAGIDHDIENTATASSNKTGAVTDSAEVVLITTPSLAIDKEFVSVVGGNRNVLRDAAGDVLNYTVTVTNTGNVTLTGVTVVDPLTGQNISGVTLAPGTSQTFNSSYTLTQADLDNNGGGDGTIDNTATADSNETSAVMDSVQVPLSTHSALSIDKTFVNVTGGNGNVLPDAVGDVLNYTVTVTNAGNVTLTGVTVVDPLTGQNDSITTLAPGESRSFNSSYTLTQADLDGQGNAGSDHDIDNTATADSNETGAVSDSAEVALVTTPSLAINKAFVNVTGGNGNGTADAVGDVLNYTVTVTNTGNVTLTGVTVVDPLTGQNDSITTLAPGESRSFNSSYTLTQADLDNNGGGDGTIDNTATADSNETSAVTDSAQVPLASNTALSINKAFVNVTGGNGNVLPDAVGDVLNYTVTVTNTGNVTLTGVTVTDPLTGQNISGVTLAPGVSQTFNSSYTLTQADLDNNGGGDGTIDNTATASSNETNAVTDSVQVPLITIPRLTIDKTFAGVTGGNGNTEADSAGDVLNYTVTVTNAGNVTLTGVTVVDPLTGQNISGVTLAPGTSQTFNSSYTLTQADLDGQDNAGSDHDIDNTATADSNETGAVSDSAEVALVTTPSLAINKAFVNVTGGNGNVLPDAAGDVLNYTVKVTNTGNVTLTGVTVVDPLTGQNISGLTLAPGASQTFNSSYTLTQADLDGQGNAGADHDIDNTATADSNETSAISDSAQVPLFFNPALAIDKAFAGVTGGNGNVLPDAAGDVLNYTVKVTNTGNVTLTGVTVTDPLTGQNISGVTLAPGVSQTFNSSYTLAQADLNGQGNAGVDHDIDNTATADSNETNAISDSVQVPLVFNPALAIDKSFVNVTGGNGNGQADAAGDVLNYTVKVTNTGNVTLTGVTVTDPLTGQNISGVTLAPGTSQTFNSSYTLTQADLNGQGNAGADHDIDNTATADSNETNAVTDSVQVPLVFNPALAIDKSFVNVTGGNGNGQADAAGDVLNYTVKVNNTGNVTLTGVTVVDPLTGQNISGVTLAPGASQTFNSSYTLTQADLNGGGNAGADHGIDNTATADSNETNAVTDSVQVPLVFNPALAIDKSFVNVTGGNNNGQADAVGDVLNYKVTVTNAGNVTLTGVTVVDLLTGQNVSGGTLAPGTSQTFNTSYTLTQADLNGQGNAGADRDIDNTATADSNETGAVSDSVQVPLIVNTAPPVLDLDANNSAGGGFDYTTTFRIGGSPVPIADTDVLITDPDSTTMASARISVISNGQVQPNDRLSINGTLPAGIIASAYDPSTGVLTLTGVASKAAYETALHQVVFSTTNPSTADHIVSVTVNDGTNTSNLAQTFVHIASALVSFQSLDTTVPADTENWMSSDPAQQTAATPGFPDGYPLYVTIPTNPGQHVESTGTIPDGVFYFDGASYVALTAGVTLYDSSLGINLLDDLVYRPTANPDDTLDVNLSLDVSNGLLHVSENVSIHERPPTALLNSNDPSISAVGDLVIADQIYGASGNDVLSGNGRDDIIIGRDGDDILRGGAGNDVLDGGADTDTDTATYVAAAGGVTVDLNILTPQDTGGDGTDTLIGIENIFGSVFADALTGDANANRLFGAEGDDTLTGGLGSDRLSGGAGADHFVYTSTADGGSIADQTGADHIATFDLLEGDSIDVLASAFGGGLVAGTDATGIFGSGADDTFGSSSERFHFNTTTQTLLYDSNGSDPGGTQVALAQLENGGPVDAAHIHVV